MSVKRVQWVKYRSMGGPRYMGEKEKNGKYKHVYEPQKPWGVWSQIMGVVAACEGNYDTVVMYDETGVTAGFMQWTFKSGRLQNLLQYLKSIPCFDFSKTGVDENLFDDLLRNDEGQVFNRFGFSIKNGRFFSGGKTLNPAKKKEQKKIVDVCMGRFGGVERKNPKSHATALCKLFAELGQTTEFQAAQIEFGKMEFKRALDARRPPLKSVGGTIRHLLPEEIWGTPIPAIFFNLYQNAPMGAFKLFMNSMKKAAKKGLVELTRDDGYVMVDHPPGGLESDLRELLNIIWLQLNKTAYADWGFRSKQYLESGGKNPPRIKRIRPAIEEYYGVKLPYIK